MKNRRFLTLFAVLLVLSALLCSCGAAVSNEGVYPEEAPMEMKAESAARDTLANAAPGEQLPLPENRKWVVTVNLHAETEDLDALLNTVFAQVEELEGYIENQNIHNGTAYAARRYRSAELTARIPAQKVDSFTDQVAGHANVVSNSKNLEDITLQYVDTETRMKALEVEEARLLELMEKAETMSDLLEIEGRLTDVRYEKERVTSRMRTFDNQVDYATVYLTIEEVREYTPVEEPTVWERISGGFMDSLKGVGTGAVDLLVWILASLPWLVIWAIVITLAVLLIRKLRKNRKLKKQSRSSQKGENT